MNIKDKYATFVAFVRRNAGTELILPLILVMLKVLYLSGVKNYSYAGVHLVIYDLLSTFVIYYLVFLLIDLSRFRAIRIPIKLLFIYFFILLSMYYRLAHDPAGFSVLRDNIDEFLTPLGSSLVYSFVSPASKRFVVIFSLLLIIVEYRFRVLSYIKIRHHLPKVVILAILSVFPITLSTGKYMDELVYFFRDGFRAYFISGNIENISIQKLFKEEGVSGYRFESKDFPYVRVPTIRKQKRNLHNPDIFLVMIESLTDKYVDKKINGIEVTPFLNSLKKKGVYFDKFHGNSIQTCRGQFALFCSVLPSYNFKVFKKYKDNSFNCLPKILSSHGYSTVFMKAYFDLSFDDTGDFAKVMGFQKMRGMKSPFDNRKDEINFIWGWGLQDNFAFREMFKYLDSIDERKPLFASITTVSNHNPFNKIPKRLRNIHSNPSTFVQNYENSIHVTDDFLREFFVQLEKRKRFRNSIVFITGDHGFPLNQHGNIFQGKQLFEENLRTPMIIYAPHIFKPETIDSVPYSQIDFAPTVLDLLDIRDKNHFLGISMLQKSRKNRFIFSSQPYDGTYLSVIKWPYKLLYRMVSDRFFLYDLQKDPEERNDIFDLHKEDPSVRNMIEKMNYHHLNQVLIRDDRIWPRETIENTPES